MEMEENLSDSHCDEKSNGEEPAFPAQTTENSSNDKKLTGRWTKEEHQRFVDGLKKFGKNWKKVEEYVGTRTGAQIRSHAQKFFNRLQRELNNNGEETRPQESELQTEGNVTVDKEAVNESEPSSSNLNPHTPSTSKDLILAPIVQPNNVTKTPIIPPVINQPPSPPPPPPPMLQVTQQISEEDIVEVSTNLNNMIKRIQCGESLHKKEEINGCRNFLDEYLDKICKNIEESSLVKPSKEDEKKLAEKNISILENLRSILMDTKLKLEQLGPHRTRNGSFFMTAPDEGYLSSVEHEIPYSDFGLTRAGYSHHTLSIPLVYTVNSGPNGYQLQTKNQEKAEQKLTKNVTVHYLNQYDDNTNNMDTFDDFEPSIEKRVKTMSQVWQIANNKKIKISKQGYVIYSFNNQYQYPKKGKESGVYYRSAIIYYQKKKQQH